MATNMFKKHLSVFVKTSAKLVIYREADFYYICDGYTMLKMPAVHYDMYARPVSSVFLPLDNGQSAVRGPGEALPSVTAPSYNAAKIFNSHTAEKPAIITDLLHLAEVKKIMRFVNVDNEKIAIYNSAYIDAVLAYADIDRFTATADRFPVLKWESTDNRFGCLIMPVNNAMALNNLKELGGILRK